MYTYVTFHIPPSEEFFKKYLQREIGVSEDVKITKKNMLQMWDKYYKPPLDVTLGSDLDASLGPDLDVSLGRDLDVLLGIGSNSEHELGSDDEELLALLDTF